MRLAELLAGEEVALSGSVEVEVTGLTHDSRRVAPGDLFVALAGERFDGSRFVPQAVERGAVAVLAGRPGSAGDRAWITVDEPRRLMGRLAARLHGHPDRELTMVGVTGTNGKSTTVALLESVLEAAGRPAGVFGTLGYHFRSLTFPGERTTPEAPDLFAGLAAMKQAGARAVAMEVSSHALALERVAEVRFDVAIFTNLTRDHLDFHAGFEDYFAAKRRLFGLLKPGGIAVVNVDDPWGRRLAEELDRPLTFGRDGAVRILESQLDSRGIAATFGTPRGALEVRSPLLGAFNLANIHAVVAAGEALALDREAIAGGIADRHPIEGRMEPVDRGQPFPVFIDFAHTDAALRAALESLKEFTGARVLLVFGCGGDRDPGKRALMGRVAGELADLPIVTSDNPRGEDPLAIVSAVEEGLREAGNTAYRIVPDRREAIRRAVAVAERGWAVLVAGKGHERDQRIGDQVLPFADREELEAALEERFGTTASG